VANVVKTISFGSGDVGVGFGEWVPLTLSEKVETGTEHRQAAARLEDGGATVRLRGELGVKPGQVVEAGGILATIPVGLRPPAPVTIPAVISHTISEVFTINAGPLEISSAGPILAFVQLGAKAPEEAGVVELNDLTFAVT
jgi:hypothetical protein